VGIGSSKQMMVNTFYRGGGYRAPGFNYHRPNYTHHVWFVNTVMTTRPARV
jgi:hypothetical protein